MVKNKTRAGGILIEAVIATALMLTATVALTRYAQSAGKLSDLANRNLNARLASENAAERMRHFPADRWSSLADEVGKSVSRSSAVTTKIMVTDFQTDDRDAVHAIIQCQIGGDPGEVVENHCWKFAGDNSEPPTNGDTKAVGEILDKGKSTDSEAANANQPDEPEDAS